MTRFASRFKGCQLNENMTVIGTREKITSILCTNRPRINWKLTSIVSH